MNRRAVLAAAPAALFPASLASAMPEAETPVRRLYREFQSAYAFANARDIDDGDEIDRRVTICNQIEDRLDAEPSQTMQDLAMKVAVCLGAWDRHLNPRFAPGLCAEVDALAGAIQ